ncbi:guanine nucleotide-binding protein subunit gamma 3 [Jatropha curcas]|uniref:guanine nucleotide-binding protein subunit gamma 3 n=1 Tax=Jatropha curcas TaxID=180498 RepID=UPI0005FC0398|nr:guanine nucleotide-binding protein subunit gamma 3 [Jatropha curcas]
MMDGRSNSTSSSSSLPPTTPVCPKSPPGGLDLFGKRRQLVKVQILEREIGLLQEELKTIEGLQPASRSCKELEDFIGAKQDPLVAINEKVHKSRLRCKKLCCLPWICCSSGCGPRFERPKCCACCPISCLNLCSCLQKMNCQNCCKFTSLSCPHLGCCCFNSSHCNCTKVNLCCCCSKTSNSSCC